MRRSLIKVGKCKGVTDAFRSSPVLLPSPRAALPLHFRMSGKKVFDTISKYSGALAVSGLAFNQCLYNVSRRLEGPAVGTSLKVPSLAPSCYRAVQEGWRSALGLLKRNRGRLPASSLPSERAECALVSERARRSGARWPALASLVVGQCCTCLTRTLQQTKTYFFF